MGSLSRTEFAFILRHAWRRWSKPLGQITISLLIAFGTLFIWNRSEGVFLNQWVLRHFFEVRGPREPPKDLMLVAIDDETYQRLQASTNFPLPRRFIADALEQINSAEPKAIILDATIPPEPTLDPVADARIEAALRAGPTTICSGELPAGPETGKLLTLGSDERFKRAAKMELPMIVFGNEGVISYISFTRDPRASLYERAPVSRALVELAGMTIRTPGENDLINFYGPAGTVSRLPLFELVSRDGKAAVEKLRGKVVLMGYQSLARGRGTMDKDEFYVTASSHPMFGVEIHANIIGNLLDGSWLKRASLVAERNTLFLASLILSSIATWMNPRKSVPTIGILMAAALVFAYLGFSHLNLWWSGIGPLILSAIVSLVAAALYHIARTDRFRDYLNRTFTFKFDRDL